VREEATESIAEPVKPGDHGWPLSVLEDADRPKKANLTSRKPHFDLDVRQASLEGLRVTGPGSGEIEVGRTSR
jgi:hypothetical protein